MCVCVFTRDIQKMVCVCVRRSVHVSRVSAIDTESLLGFMENTCVRRADTYGVCVCARACYMKPGKSVILAHISMRHVTHHAFNE